MAVGLPLKTTYADGDVYKASDVNDTNGTINAYLAPSLGYSAGKNRILNGDFSINQRNFTSTSTALTYGFDRWKFNAAGSFTPTYSAQTFAAGTAPVSGYEGTNYARLATTANSGTGDYCIFAQLMEDVRTFAGQTVTVSFWAKAASGTPKVGVELAQNFGSGGSLQVNGTGQAVTISTSWARYSVTVSVPSISGKTIGTSSYIELNLWTVSGSTYATRSGSVGNQTATIDFWGVQVEKGSTATAFQTATGTIQGELAACQRYYWNITGADKMVGMGTYQTATEMNTGVTFPVTMRTTPTVSAATGTGYYGLKTNGSEDLFDDFNATVSYSGSQQALLYGITGVSGTVGRSGGVRTVSASAKIEFSAEL